MNPSSTLLVRRAVGALFVVWAVLGIAFALNALRRPAHELCHPFTDARVGGVAVVMDMAPSMQGKGVDSGDRRSVACVHERARRLRRRVATNRLLRGWPQDRTKRRTAERALTQRRARDSNPWYP